MMNEKMQEVILKNVTHENMYSLVQLYFDYFKIVLPSLSISDMPDIKDTFFCPFELGVGTNRFMPVLIFSMCTCKFFLSDSECLLLVSDGLHPLHNLWYSLDFSNLYSSNILKQDDIDKWEGIS